MLAFDVRDEPVALSSVSLSVSGVSASQSYTFASLVDSTREGSVHAQFADGTQIDDVLSADWLPAGSLVTFATSDAGVISSGSTSGEFTLHANSEARTTLSALSACDATVRSDVAVPMACRRRTTPKSCRAQMIDGDKGGISRLETIDSKIETTTSTKLKASLISSFKHWCSPRPMNKRDVAMM